MDAPSYTNKGLVRRGTRLILVGVIALAVIGFIVGLRQGVPEGRPQMPGTPRGETLPQGAGIPSPTYADVGRGVLRAGEPPMTWEALTRALRPPPAEPVTDMAAREASLATRATRRAFNGAPPVIPHASAGLDDRSCLACHGTGLQIGGRTAKAQPHPPMTNCRQCHAPAAPDFLAARGGALAENDWVGIAAPREGRRAGPGAPPVVPHTLQLRDNCLACHGPHGWPGMQSSHPERRSCLQCHAPTKDGAHPGRGIGAPPFLPAPRVHEGPSR